MRATLVLFLLAAAFALVCAQGGYRCIAPTQWHSRVFAVDPEKRAEEAANVTYDATNKRIYTSDRAREAPGREFTYAILELYNERTLYKIDPVNKRCEKEPLTEEFRPVGVPEEARFEGAFVLGGPGGIIVYDYVGEVKTSNETFYYSITVVEPGCYPLTERLLATNPRNSVERTFYDLVGGIPDPEVFIPPDYC